MFSKQPQYTIEQINAAIEGLRLLEQLQDKCEQTLRLNSTKMNQETVTEFRQRYDRYSQNIASRQKLIAFMEGNMMQGGKTI